MNHKITKNWPLITFFGIYHVLALVALFHFSWKGFFTFLVLYFITGCLGITMGYHRYFTHRTFKASKFLERVLAVSGTLSLQGSVLMWVGHHRMHHAGSDTEKDPHNAENGFWYSHMGWMLNNNPDFDDEAKLRRFARDITADPFLMWLCKPSVMIGMQVLLGVVLFAFGGLSTLMWGAFFRTVFLYHSTWLVNSAAHIWGYKNFKTEDRATNNWIVALLSWGEGWHNNHHAYGESVKAGYKFWEVDVTYMVIRLSKFFGQAWDLKYSMPGQSSAKTIDLAATAAIAEPMAAPLKLR